MSTKKSARRKKTIKKDPKKKKILKREPKRKKTIKKIDKKENEPEPGDNGNNKNMIDNYEIIDIEISNKENKGTLASSRSIDYHYQNLDNIVEYFNILHKKKKLKSGNLVDKGKVPRNDRAKAGAGEAPIKGNKYMIKSFSDQINFFRKSVDHSLIQVNIPKKVSEDRDKIEGIYTTIDEFINNLKQINKKRFTPITINNLLPLGNGQIENHANMILIDNELKQIELFEPHGYKSDKTSENESGKAYKIKIDALKDFFIHTDLDHKIGSKIRNLSTYKFINSVDFVQKAGFQQLFDSNSGYCVTWSALYCHYRILNPDIPVNVLVKYINKSIVTGTILRYAKHIEDTLKHKIK